MAPVTNRQDSYRKAERAYRLRCVGRPWQEIADSEGFKTRRGAQLAVQRHLAREQPESVEDQRRSATDGLRITKSVLFATLSDAKRRGDNQAVVSAARAIADMIEKDAKLNGLHVPVAQQVDVSVTQTPTAVIDRLEAELLALVAQRRSPAAIGGGNIIDAEIEEITR